jgi:hypothetical protein
MTRRDDHQDNDLPYQTNAKLRLRGSWKSGGVAYIEWNGKTSKQIRLCRRRFAVAGKSIERSLIDLQDNGSARGFRTADALHDLANQALRQAAPNARPFRREAFDKSIYWLRKLLKPPGVQEKNWGRKFFEQANGLGYRFSTHPDNLSLVLTDDAR